MAGPQDYLTVKGPEGASYQLPKFDLGSQIAQIPTSYQEGQQYAVKRSLQTMFQNNPDLLKPDPATGQIDLGAIATNAMKIGGPEAAAPFFNLMMQQQGSADFSRMMGGGGGAGGQPQGQPQGTPQSYRPAPNAPNSATGPDGIRGPSSTGGGSIFPYPPGTSPPQIVAGGPQPQGGAGLQGQPAPFAGNRGTAFNDRVPQYGGMSNRDQQNAPPGPVGGGTLTQDGTTGQPTAPTSARETANNGLPDVLNDPVISRQRKIIDIASNFLGTHPIATPGQIAGAKARIDEAQKAIEQRTDLLNKNAALTEQQKTSIGAGRGLNVAGSEGDIEYQKEDAKRFTKISGDISTAEKEAQAERPQLGLIKSIMADPQFYSGAAAGLVQKYRQWTVALGGDPKAGLPQEAFGKAVQNLALSQIRAMAGTGPVRVAEMRIIQQAIANKDYTPDTNRLLIEIADRNYARNQQIATMKRQYQSGPGRGRIDSGFEQQISAYDQQNPIFSPAELNDPRIIAPRRFRTPAEAQAAGLPPGTPYSDMTGKHLKMIQ